VIQDAGLTPDEVLAAAADFRTPRLMLMTAPVLVLWVFVFWGGLEAGSAEWFSVGTLWMAAFWSFKGWEPWKMVPHRLLMGLPLAPKELSPIQRVTAEFFRTPRCRRIQGAWIALGSVFPWLIYGVSAVCDGRPLRPGTHPTAWWAMVLLGVIEGVRGRAPALYSLAGQLQKNWPDLLRRAEEPDAAT
jgi:hypothetical protein